MEIIEIETLMSPRLPSFGEVSVAKDILGSIFSVVPPILEYDF